MILIITYSEKRFSKYTTVLSRIIACAQMSRAGEGRWDRVLVGGRRGTCNARARDGSALVEPPSQWRA